MFKKISLISVIILFSILSANAQAFKKGKLGINAGGTVLIIGDITPGVHLSVDIGIIKINKKLVVGVGAASDVNFIDPDIIGYHAGLRATLHYGDRNAKTYDIYGGLGLGLPFYEEHGYAYPFYFNQFIGARILFTKRFGFFGEVGLGSTNIRLGFTVII